MDNQNDQKKFVCKSCDSESQEKAGMCCGGEREEKKDVGVCTACSCPCDEHKEHTHK